MYDQIRKLREWVPEFVRQVIAPLIQYTFVAVSSPLGDGDTSEGHKTNPDEPSYQYPNRRIQHFGFRSVPPQGVSTVRLLSSSGATNAVTVGEESTRFGPGDLAVGEAALYCLTSGTIIKLEADGDITIIPGSGKTVNIAEGSNGVARLGDSIRVTGAILQTIMDTRYVQLGSPAPLGDATGTITTASSKVKAG